MYVIFTKNKDRWKFYAFISRSEHLESEIAHLKDQNVEAITQQVQKFDIDQIGELESKMNESK